MCNLFFAFLSLPFCSPSLHPCLPCPLCHSTTLSVSILSPASSINCFHFTPISSGYVTQPPRALPPVGFAKFLCNVKIQFGLNELCNICISFTRLTLICSRLCQKLGRDFYFSWQSAAKRKRVDPNRPAAATGSILTWTFCNLLVAQRVARKRRRGRRRRRRREEKSERGRGKGKETKAEGGTVMAVREFCILD